MSRRLALLIPDSDSWGMEVPLYDGGSRVSSADQNSVYLRAGNVTEMPQKGQNPAGPECSTGFSLDKQISNAILETSGSE